MSQSKKFMLGKLTFIKQSLGEMKLIKMSSYVHKDRLTSRNFERIEMHVLKHLKFKVEILTCVIKITKVSISMGGGGSF